MKTVEFDHHDSKFVSNHQEKYAQLRETCPVGYSTAHGGFWVLSRFDDVVAVARNDKDFTSEISLLIPPGNIDRMIPLQSDPPDTERYRRVLMPYFSRQSVERHAETIRADIASAIDELVSQGGGEIVGAVATPVPAKATMRLLGFPEAMWRTFADPIHQATYGEPGTRGYQLAERKIGEFAKFIAAEVDARQVEDSHDMVSDLVHRPNSTEALTRDEIIDLVRMVIFGGMDTVTGAISNITAILATDMALQTRLGEAPETIPDAVEEFLRFEAPIQGFARKTNCPVQIGAQSIGQGELVWVNWGAANHDPRQFQDPECLDIARNPNRHLAFGIGQHVCLGARLARLELRIFLEELVSRAPLFALGGGGIELPGTIGQLLCKKKVEIRFIG
ncbi:MAG: cytochrome P450 [Rhizobiaceae bacterium]